jgi:hypothetical protein
MWNNKTLAWAAGAAGAAALAVTALLVAGSSSAARPPTAMALAAPAVQPLLAPRAVTGTLAVNAPPGSSVIIGSTVYPAGNLELPPGDYQIRLKRGVRGRGLVRRVTIAAGTVTPIKL